MYSDLLIDALFVLSVSLIWFMLAYQSLLFFLGHLYYRRTRRPPERSCGIPDQDLPAISVLVPCHNEERVIAATLRSLLALDYPSEKLEILIINDGSTDRTLEIAATFACSRVRVLDVPPDIAARGKASALNFGLRHASAPLLAVYDADNTPESTALRPLAEELVHGPNLAAAVGLYRAVNRHRNLLTRFLNIEGIGFQWILQAGRWMLMGLTTVPGTNYVIRRSLVEDLGGWDEDALTEDAELTLRIYRAGYTVKFVPASVTWEQEPQTLRVWMRQRNRWVRGHNYLIRKYAAGLLAMKPRRIGLELLYSLWLYYVFFLAMLVSDLLFLLGTVGLVRMTIPGPYGVIWIFAYITFVLQLVISLAREGNEDTPRNILLVMLMYFTYCQLWIPVVARAFYDDFIVRRPSKWAKTERFEVAS